MKTLRRRTGASDAELDRGNYRQLTRTELNGDWASATLSCPGCGAKSALDRKVHKVDAFGRVEPGIHCPTCDYGDTVELEDWEPEAKGTA